MALQARGDSVEKLFSVAPGADPSLIQLSISGADELQVNESGELEAGTALGTIALTQPVAYQEIDGRREFVDVAYSFNDNEYGFAVGRYDPAYQLIIDPYRAIFQ